MVNPFYSFYNNLLDFYLTSYHTQLHNASAHFRVILNDLMLFITIFYNTLLLLVHTF